MRNKMTSKFKLVGNAFIAALVVLVVSTFNISPAMAFAGTLENGNMAYAQSTFATGEACNYLPGFETGYDAWHFVLTTRGATFQQSPTNPAVAINLNFVFMRQDNSLFVIKSGAWVQTGKGAYVYTPVQDRIRMVQAGTVALINGSDSGMRLSHTCPGSGSAPVASPSPTPTTSSTPTASPTPTASASRTPTPTPTPTASASRTPTPTPTPTSSATPTPTASATPTPTPTPSSTVIPTLRPRPNPTASAIQQHPVGPRNPLPTPSPTQQGIVPSPTPTPTASPTPSQPAQSPTPTSSPEPSQSPNGPAPVVPTPPPVNDPNNVLYVDPVEPTTITPVEPPQSPIEIVIPPKYGTIEISPSNEITYIPKPGDPLTPKVDVVELKYTNLSGQVVVIRKEIILTQKGDVPKIIQTGYGPSNNALLPSLLIIVGMSIIIIRGLRSGRKYE